MTAPSLCKTSFILTFKMRRVPESEVEVGTAALLDHEKSNGYNVFRLNCMCPLIRQTWRQTHTQTHKLTLLCCWLGFYWAFGKLVQVITLVVSQSELCSSSSSCCCFLLTQFSHLRCLYLFAIFPTDTAPDLWTDSFLHDCQPIGVIDN